MRIILIPTFTFAALIFVGCQDQADQVKNSIGQAKAVKSQVEDITAKRMDEANRLLAEEVKRADDDEDVEKK